MTTPNAGYEQELAERQKRSDLCAECVDPDHVTCSMDPECSCCQGTIVQLDEEDAVHIDSSGTPS